jgi:DNA-binding NtrC family response regulator
MDIISIEQRFSGADEKVTVLPRTGENDSGASVNVFTPHSADQLLIRAGMTVHDVEKSLILETLRSTSNNRTQAAQLLGISVRTLRNKLAEYRLPSELEGDDAIDEASSG